MIVDPELISGFSGSQWQHCAMEVINGNAVQCLVTTVIRKPIGSYALVVVK